MKYRKKPVEVEAHQISTNSTPREGALDMNAASHAVIAGWMLSTGFTGFRVTGKRKPVRHGHSHARRRNACRSG